MSAVDVPEPPPVAQAVFGAGLERAVEFSRLLCTDGVVRGLIGPREPERIWNRHLLNCAVLGELIAPGLRVVDVGSGAGLPGVAMAVARPDLQVDLLEPLQRRVEFLELLVTELELGDRVRVIRARAEEPAAVDAVGGSDWVVARAVAPLDRLVRWCLPLARSGGRLGLLKGESAEAEVAVHRDALHRAGAREIDIRLVGVGVVEPLVTVVTMTTPAGSRR